MTAIIDYDAGNIRSVVNALQLLGEDVCLTDDHARIDAANRVILPGVGAFGDAMERIRARGLEKPIRKCVADGKPFLGICLGLQLLFDESEESPGVPGLGLLRGRIVRLPDRVHAAPGGFPTAYPEGTVLKIPQIGWNSLNFTDPDGRRGRLFEGLDEGSYVYFVHSYYLQSQEPGIVTATTDYGVCVEASVEKGNLFACQFHPEKSERTGLQILRNFLQV